MITGKLLRRVAQAGIADEGAADTNAIDKPDGGASEAEGHPS